MKKLFSIKNIVYIVVFIILFIAIIFILKPFVKHGLILAAATLSLALATFLMVIETRKSIESNADLENKKLDNEKIAILVSFKEEIEFLKKKYLKIINEPIIPVFDESANEERLISLSELPEENQDNLRINPGFKTNINFTPIFDQNIGKIGLINSETAREIIDIYNNIKEFNNKIEAYNKEFEEGYKKIKNIGNLYSDYEEVKLFLYNLKEPSKGTKEIYLKNISLEFLKNLCRPPIKYITGNIKSVKNKIVCVEFDKKVINESYPNSLGRSTLQLQIENLNLNDNATHQFITQFWTGFFQIGRERGYIVKHDLSPPPPENLRNNDPIYPEYYNDLYNFTSKFSEKTIEIKKIKLLYDFDRVIELLKDNINILKKQNNFKGGFMNKYDKKIEEFLDANEKKLNFDGTMNYISNNIILAIVFYIGLYLLKHFNIHPASAFRIVINIVSGVILMLTSFVFTALNFARWLYPAINNIRKKQSLTLTLSVSILFTIIFIIFLEFYWALIVSGKF
jgi:hypothetical protein